MRVPSFIFALFLVVSHLLSLPVTLASPAAPLDLLRRQFCTSSGGGCRFVEAPAVADPIQLSSTPSSTPLAEPQVAVAASSSGSGSTPDATPTPTTGSSSKNSNAGVSLVSQGKLFFAALTALAATMLVF